MKRAGVLVFVVLLGAAGLVSAQNEPGPMTWLAYEMTESGKSRDLVGATIENDGPMYDELLENGTLSSWGIAIPINHHLGDTWNYMLWATMSGWADVQTLQGGFMNLFASLTPEAMAENQRQYDEATVDGSHHDVIIRHWVHDVGDPDEVPVPKYFHISYWKAAPEGFEAMIDFYKDQVAPIFEKHQTAGDVVSYGISTQELHGHEGWTHVTWYTVPELGAIDKVQASLDADMDPAEVGKIMEVMDWEAHWDQVLLIVHLGGMPSEE